MENTLTVSTRAILIHMPEPLVDCLDEIALRYGISRSELIRLTLKLHQGAEPLPIEVRLAPDRAE